MRLPACTHSWWLGMANLRMVMSRATLKRHLDELGNHAFLSWFGRAVEDHIVTVQLQPSEEVLIRFPLLHEVLSGWLSAC